MLFRNFLSVFAILVTTAVALPTEHDTQMTCNGNNFEMFDWSEAMDKVTRGKGANYIYRIMPGRSLHISESGDMARGGVRISGRAYDGQLQDTKADDVVQALARMYNACKLKGGSEPAGNPMFVVHAQNFWV